MPKKRIEISIRVNAIVFGILFILATMATGSFLILIIVKIWEVLLG
jgi:hypothetical protein